MNYEQDKRDKRNRGTDERKREAYTTFRMRGDVTLFRKRWQIDVKEHDKDWMNETERQMYEKDLSGGFWASDGTLPLRRSWIEV